MTPRRTPPAKYVRQILVRVTVEQHDALLALAAENERTIAAEVRRALRFYISDGGLR